MITQQYDFNFVRSLVFREGRWGKVVGNRSMDWTAWLKAHGCALDVTWRGQELGSVSWDEVTGWVHLHSPREDYYGVADSLEEALMYLYYGPDRNGWAYAADFKGPYTAQDASLRLM